MFAKNNYCLCNLMLLFCSLLLYSARGYSQDSLTNAYTYIHPIHNRAVSRSDSFKVKTGHWIEYDTLYVPLQELKDHKWDIINSAPSVYKTEGRYLTNAKSGWWKYFDANGVLYKEVSYDNGTIKVVKYYRDNGKLRFWITCPGFEECHYEQYDSDGKKVAEGNAPVELLDAAANHR